MAIYLIRHGETPGNAGRVVQTAGTPLGERGLLQARRLAERLERTSIARILASDLTRAAMTAEPLREVLDVPLALEPLLQERNFGELRGTPYAELEVDIFAAGFAPPGGETWETFDARVDQAWRRVTEVARATRGHLAVVTHGLVCFSLATRHLALPPEAEPRLGFANTSVTIARAAPPHEVTLFNCTAHLAGEREEGKGAGSATRA
jgi:broad specificity phosphatase PhoE